MQSICIQYDGVTIIKSYSSWVKAVQAVEEHLKLYYPNLKDCEVELIMLQLEERPYVIYKNFYADLSQKGSDVMSNKTIGEVFKEKFKGYHVIVNPPCISWNRESQYIEEAMRVCLGDTKANRGNIIIDHNNKKVWYNR